MVETLAHVLNFVVDLINCSAGESLHAVSLEAGSVAMSAADGVVGI